MVSIFFFIFTCIWGRWTHFDEHIFLRGWFNHQPGNKLHIFSKGGNSWPAKGLKPPTSLCGTLPFWLDDNYYYHPVTSIYYPHFGSPMLSTKRMTTWGMGDWTRWVVSNIFLFSPRTLGKWSNWTDVSNGLVQPPTSYIIFLVFKMLFETM